ncbi:MAG: DUF4124 domain-containing protein [Sulfuricellaceae bacterium]|nr:DUF4124 domain-containing protein [Sulfuricellaceae bacterium]
MKKIVILSMCCAVFSAQAGAFKCQDGNGRTVYQETPCEQASLKSVGTIKAPELSSDEERARMKGINKKASADFDDAMSTRKKMEKSEKEEREAAHKRSLDERNAIASERQARAAERDAQASEVRNTLKR